MAAADRVAADRVVADRAVADRAAADRVAADRVAADRTAHPGRAPADPDAPALLDLLVRVGLAWYVRVIDDLEPSLRLICQEGEAAAREAGLDRLDWAGQRDALLAGWTRSQGPLRRLATQLALTPADLFLLGLAVACERRRAVALAVAALQAPFPAARPSVHLALDLVQVLFETGPGDALALAAGPLTECGLLTLAGDDALPQCVLTVRLPLWQALAGGPPRWPGCRLTAPAPAAATGVPALALERARQAIAAGEAGGVVVRGPPGSGRAAVAAALARRLGLAAIEVPLPVFRDDRGFATACSAAGWMPLLRLTPDLGEAVVIGGPVGGLGGGPGGGLRAAGPVAVLAGTHGAVQGDRLIELALAPPPAAERIRLWRAVLGERARGLTAATPDDPAPAVPSTGAATQGAATPGDPGPAAAMPRNPVQRAPMPGAAMQDDLTPGDPAPGDLAPAVPSTGATTQGAATPGDPGPAAAMRRNPVQRAPMPGAAMQDDLPRGDPMPGAVPPGGLVPDVPMRGPPVPDDPEPGAAGPAASILSSALLSAAVLYPGTIEAVGRSARLRAETEDRPVMPADIAEARLALAPDGLGRLAHAVTRSVGAEALVTTPGLAADLAALLARCRRRESIWDGLGPSLGASATRGVRVLFAGESGTGKTMAAAYVATALAAPLYRCDLAAVMNKYIGESEKNLGSLLDYAEAADVVLLFDEADALFGRRTEGSETGERYANMLTNYLLTRLEAHHGIVILTSNAKARIDPAFWRRLDQVIDFPTPGYEERLALWKSHLGTRAPAEATLERLAAYCDLSGGGVRNAVLAAAAMAPPAGPIGLDCLNPALQREYAKLRRTVPAGLALAMRAAE